MRMRSATMAEYVRIWARCSAQRHVHIALITVHLPLLTPTLVRPRPTSPDRRIKQRRRCVCQVRISHERTQCTSNFLSDTPNLVPLANVHIRRSIASTKASSTEAGRFAQYSTTKKSSMLGCGSIEVRSTAGPQFLARVRLSDRNEAPGNHELWST
jgi:hypothetical protein